MPPPPFIRLIEIFFAENARFFEYYVSIFALKIGDNLTWYGTLHIFFAWRGWIFEKRIFRALNSPFVNGMNAGRHRCCGIEERTVVAYGCRKTKKGNIWHGRGKCFGLQPPAFPPSQYKVVLFIYRCALAFGIIWSQFVPRSLFSSGVQASLIFSPKPTPFPILW